MEPSVSESSEVMSDFQCSTLQKISTETKISECFSNFQRSKKQSTIKMFNFIQ